MLLVIVGAGASFDSAQGEPRHGDYRPPLAKDLFAAEPLYVETLSRFPRATPIVALVRQAVAGGASVESVLEGLRDEVGTYPLRRQHLLGVQFYLRSLLGQCSTEWSRIHGGVTNYTQLVDIVEMVRVQHSQSVMYVNFNYDTLLEQAIESAGLASYDSMDSYVTGNVQVVKVHGSVNWGERVVCDDFERLRHVTATQICDLVDRWTATGEYHISGASIDDQEAADGIYVPAIAIPTQTKSDFACPKGHITALRKALSNVDGLIAIGWRGAENQFLGLLRGGLPRETPALVVTESAKACAETEARLEDAGLSTVTSFENGFSGLVRDDVIGARRLRLFTASVAGRPQDRTAAPVVRWSRRPGH
jgi:hypothetical protein